MTTNQVLSQGFGSYLQDILPADVAIAAGAFGVAMMQVRNISAIPVEKFAQVVANIETTAGLSLNGTNVPVDVTLASSSLALIALGSGPNGTYTMADFFGAMSGLPYDWKTIQSLVLTLQTTALIAIYNSLYARLISGVILNIDADIQTLIDAANVEISSIKSSQLTNATKLNTLWDKTGTQLSIEQRARTIGLAPLPSPRDNNIAPYPITQYSFVDAVPRMAIDTRPYMAAQTIEAIADLCTTGGQSIIGMMREARNTARLASAGIPLDNNIPSNPPPKETAALIANGTSNGTTPANPQQTMCDDPTILKPQQAGVYDAATNSYILYNPTPVGSIAGGTVATGAGGGAGGGGAGGGGAGAPSGIGQSVDTGQVSEPGSFAGSPYQELIPPELKVLYTSGVLLPAIPTVQNAIDEVVRCNCDCWEVV